MLSVVSIKVSKDNTAKFYKDLKKLGDKKVFVGVPSAGGKNREGITNSSLAYIMSNGSERQGIPPTPFLQPAIEKEKNKINEQLKLGAVEVLSGKSSVDAPLNKAGLIAVSAVKNYIKAGEGFAPLKESTIKARQRKGFKGTKRLIRTGQLLNSITYILKGK